MVHRAIYMSLSVTSVQSHRSGISGWDQRCDQLGHLLQAAAEQLSEGHQTAEHCGMEVASLLSASNFGPLENCPVWSLSRNPTAHGASRDGQCVSALTKKRYFKLETVNSKRVFPEFIQIIEFPVMQRSFSMTTVKRQRSKGHITGWRRLHYSKSSWQKRVRLTDASFCFLDHLPGARPPSLTSPWGCTVLLCCWCFLPITSLQSFWTPFELLQSFTVKSISEADRHGRLKPTQWFYEDKENRAPACFSLYSSRR